MTIDKIIGQLVIMMTIAIIGFLYAKLTKVTDTEQKFLSRMLLYFINPCLIFSHFNIDFDKNRFVGLCISIVVSFLVTFLFILLAEIIFRKKVPLSKLQKIGIVFTNCGFIGIPLIEGVAGGEGVFYLMGYLVAFNVMLWVYGYYQMTQKFNLVKIITNPNVLAVILGVTIYILPFKVPQAIAKPVALIGGTNTAMSMVLLGVLFGALKKEWMVKLGNTFKSFFKHNPEYKEQRKKIGTLLFTAFVRLCLCSVASMVLCGFIYFGIVKLFPSWDLVSIKLVITVIYIASLCPTGMSVSSMACLFDGDTVFSNFLVCFTHALCLVSIPAFFALFNLFLKAIGKN